MILTTRPSRAVVMFRLRLEVVHEGAELVRREPARQGREADQVDEADRHLREVAARPSPRPT